MKILVAEDDPSASRLLDATLRNWGHEVIAARDGEEAWQLLCGPEPPSLALVDWKMPLVDGPELCRRIRAQKRELYTYILLLGAESRENLVEGLKAGADDFLGRSFDDHELQARLLSGMRILEMQAQLIASREALRHQATHDPLTGLWNREAVLDILRRELARAKRDGTSIGIIMADLDHFTRVNDRLGHQIGDHILRECGQRLGSSIRLYDSVGRYGGGGFLLVLPRCEAPHLYSLAERLRDSISAKPLNGSADSVSVTCSLGAVATNQARGATQDLLLRAVDAALFRAKGRGRNRVEIATLTDMAIGTKDASLGPSIWVG